MAGFKMSNLMERTLLFLVAVPTVILAIFWPQDNHLILVTLFGIFITLLGSYEVSGLIYNKGIMINKFFLPVVNLIIYIAAYFIANDLFRIGSFKPFFPIFSLFIVGLFSLIYARDIYSKDLTRAFEKIAYTLFGVLYIGVPSFCLPFVLNVSTRPVEPISIFYNIESGGTLTGSFLVLYLLTLIWTNDIFAYLFGMWLGRNNVIGLVSSPKKSWAGYIGGYFSAFIFAAIFFLLFDRFLNLPVLFYFIPPIFTGFLVGIGDLVESVIKRSADVKDSGNIIPGRGGVLDSVDTILYLLPLFFVSLQLYFSFIQ